MPLREGDVAVWIGSWTGNVAYSAGIFWTPEVGLAGRVRKLSNNVGRTRPQVITTRQADIRYIKWWEVP